MKKVKDRLAQAWDENPTGVIVMGAFAAGAAATLINAISGARNAHTWSKEVRRRNKMTK